MNETTMPDFQEWGIRLWWNGQPICQEIVNSLQQAFEQGRVLGKRETESEWWVEQDDHTTMVVDFERASLEDYEKYEEECSKITSNHDINFCDQIMALSNVKKPWEKNNGS